MTVKPVRGQQKLFDINKRYDTVSSTPLKETTQAVAFVEIAHNVADNALVAITLMIAESKPVDKEAMVKLIVNLINSRN